MAGTVKVGLRVRLQVPCRVCRLRWVTVTEGPHEPPVCEVCDPAPAVVNPDGAVPPVSTLGRKRRRDR